MSPRTCNVMARIHFVDTPHSAIRQSVENTELYSSILSLYKSRPITTEAYLQLEI